MVEVSFYRGNLHGVPRCTRSWLMPQHSISLRNFKMLLRRRSNALRRQRLPYASNNIPTTLETQQTHENNKHEKERQQEESEQKVQPKDECTNEEKVKVGAITASSKFTEEKNYTSSEAGNLKEAISNKNNTEANIILEVKEERKNDLDVFCDKKIRKSDLEKKLNILNGNKHTLVQLLKQVLNAEEELKKQNVMQSPVSRPLLSLYGDAIVDRHIVSRSGTETNAGECLERAESEDVFGSNQSRFLHIHSTSSSQSSQLGRPSNICLQQNVVSPGNKSSNMMGTIVSPSRFAPPGHQGHATILSPLSVSGSSFVASSPSPATPGGTSVFRNHRLTSPWSLR